MDLKSTKLNELTFGHLLRLLRELSILFVLGFLIIKLVGGDIGFDFTKLSSSELVSILLAFFSIALSAAFYFAATGQSNQFYDNVNKFSKDTSELLGRLDEQVKGIGGKQIELKDSIDKYYSSGKNNNVVEEKNVTEEKAQEVQESLSNILKEIFDKSNLTAPEREKYEKALKEKDNELCELRERQNILSRRTEKPLKGYTKNRIGIFGLSEAIETDPKELLLQFANKGPSRYRRDLLDFGYIIKERPKSIGDITDKGAELITSSIVDLIDEES